MCFHLLFQITTEEWEAIINYPWVPNLNEFREQTYITLHNVCAKRNTQKTRQVVSALDNYYNLHCFSKSVTLLNSFRYTN